MKSARGKEQAISIYTHISKQKTTISHRLWV